MSNSILITLIICITIIILGIIQVIYQYISEKDNYSSHIKEYELDAIKGRIRRLENKCRGVDKE